MKLKEFMDSWLNDVIKGNVRTNTYTTYRGYINNHINRLIGEMEICEIRTEILQSFVGKLATGEKELSAKGIRSVFLTLSSAMRYAIEYEYISKNPCSKVKLPKPKEKEIQIFNREEQTELEQTILYSDDKRNFAVLLCLYTGIRIGELCALKWKNVDFQNSRLSIKNSMIRVKNYDGAEVKKTKIMFEEPKTLKSKRLLPLPEFLCSILKELKRESFSEFVFSMNGNNPIQPRTMQYIYQRLLKRAKVRYRSFHTLRHTFATRAIELGIDIKTVSEALGHSNSAVTINRYTHSLMEQKQKMMHQFNSFFGATNPLF
jgi:integrase